MFSKRGIDYLAGSLLIGIVVTVLVSLAVVPITDETFREDAAEYLMKIADDRGLFATFIGLDLASNLLGIGAAAALYLVFRSHDRNLALLGSAGFLAASVIFLTGNMIMIALESLAKDYAAATGAGAAAVLLSARPIGLMLDSVFVMGGTGLAIGFLSYGLIVLRTGAVPKWIGYVGILGGIVAPFGWLLFVEIDLQYIGVIGTMIGLLFILLTGGWLVWKGSKEAA